FRLFDVDYVEEEETTVGRVRRNRDCDENCRTHFFERFLADGSWPLARPWYGDLHRWLADALLRTRDSAIDIFLGRGLEPNASAGHQDDFQIVKHERFVAVVGDDQSNRHEAAVAITDLEDGRFFRRIVRIQRDGHALIVVGFVKGISR